MIGVEEIMKIIPHRYPFLLVDKVEIITEGAKVVGYKNVTINEPFFQGHFPNNPIMPGVLIIEAMAQVGAVAILSNEKYKGKIAYLTGIDKARFRKKVSPGDTLRFEVEIIRQKGPIGIAKGIALVDKEKVCEAEISFAIGL